ncbi:MULTISPECIES: alpha-glucosidase [unclassified Bacillus (in: firmicutes)]|uniref:glycoside hydrolase family 13 protein n=1 Tax=unclassified Bacillus (in: firmicutes) TaxID=185979 RepID=UPI0008F4374A|nr:MULTISPECIES: alpha-glucosidase [unclassified Bacillus (in: firmicutes)]SFB20004.1 oligo-1,6-glucosidase [Bacillus sp. UNCCL13]SFQ90800.1 oligo-1,6-glucosidase [Bacillus sp. cl95]
MNKTWWKESVIYQIYPRSFNDSNGDGIGDLNGITEKLPYLNKLGIDVIWLSPVYKSPNDDNGYDISDYRNIMDEFGTMEDFDNMLEEAHKHGIKIMMDLVVNHSSDEHLWFQESRKSKDNPYRDYYIWKKGVNGEPPTNWGAAFGGNVWEYDEQTDEYYLHLFSKKQPDLNWENPALREEVYEMMRYWLDKGVDGFRMDVVNFISKDTSYPQGEVREGMKYGDGSKYFMNGPRIHEFLHEMNKEALSHFDTITVGEMPGVSVEEGKLYTGEQRNELNMVFHFEHVGLGDGKYGKWDPKEWKLTDLKKIFTKWQKGLELDGWNSLYWSNHDQPRAISRWGNDSEEFRVISGKMLATCLHMLQGSPYIYQGEEIGMTNVKFEQIEDYRDIETLNAYRDLTPEFLSHEEIFKGIHERGRDNARTPIQWDASENAGFTSGTPWINVSPNYETINAEAALNDENSIFYYYQKLIQLRKQNEVIVYGKYDVLMEEDEQIYAFTRTLEGEKLLVICNFSKETPEFVLPDHLKVCGKELLISNYDVDADESIEKVVLKPYEARVYRLTN